MVGHEQYRGRLSIPYLTRAGVRTIRFRALGDDAGPKYLGLPGARTYLYNPSALLDAHDVVAICEGELDTVVSNTVVGIPSVGVAGVSQWKDHLPRCFSGVERVLVVSDNDEKTDGRNPGRELGERIARDLEQAVVITPPAGMDLSEWVLAEGPETVRKACGLAEV